MKSNATIAMTTRLLPTALVIGLAAGALSLVPTSVDAANSVAQDPPRPGDLSAQVQALEADLSLVQGLVDAVGTENAALRGEIESLTKAMSIQGKQAEKLLGVFDQAEQEGFTAGINYESRKTLLSGLRAFATEVHQATSKLDGAKDASAGDGARGKNQR